MSMIACSACNAQIAKAAPACPHCGQPNKKSEHLSGGTVFFVLLLAGGFFWWMSGGSDGAPRSVTGALAAPAMADINRQVISDALEQYRIAERSGDKNQMCVHAGFVAAAYMQAKEESNFRTWNDRKTKLCGF